MRVKESFHAYTSFEVFKQVFELTLCLACERQKFISSFFKQIEKDIKKDGGILVKQNYGGKSYLAIAVNDEKKDYLKSLILDFILKVVIEDFKYNFFKEHINSTSWGLLSDAFFMAVSIFDSEIDKEIISSLIEFDSEIVIESFFYFKLQGLREKWQRTANVINQNGIMKSEKSVIEVVKYLCAVSENNAVLVNLFFTKDKIELKNYYSEKKFKCDFAGLSNLYMEIIKLNPMKITIKGDESEHEFENVSETLKCVFEDKIYFN